MNSYEEFLAMVRLFGHPKEVEARVKSIIDKQAALDAQVAELATGRDDLAAARKAFDADVKAWKKQTHDALAAGEKAAAEKEKLTVLSAELEARSNKLAEGERKLLDATRVVNEKRVALDERAALMLKKESEYAAKKAEVEGLAGRLKAAAG